MRIKEILDQHRRDFIATMVCEHCGHEQVLDSGYDDTNFHENVIPELTCGECGRTAGPNYQPQATKYAAHQVV